MNEAEISKQFLTFFKDLGYQGLPSASLLDKSIPMSFVMSAGLVQIETLLLENRIVKGERFTLRQKCFRHFDLDRVGKDAYHLSFFEMVGAFQFGDPEISDSVQLMWDLATAVLGIDKTQLWASYFGGGMIDGNYVPEEAACKEAWWRVGLDSRQIVGLGPKDNYWRQGQGLNGGIRVRKCGPNTELFFDKGENLRCGHDCKAGCTCGRFIEFANSLFIRYEMDSKSGRVRKLSNPFTELVIGAERVAMITEEEESVFNIESFRRLIASVRGFVEPQGIEESLITESERVIADHLRALYFLIADGAPPPGKNGRERIMKLLIRHVITRQILLGITSSQFLPTVVAVIASSAASLSSSPIFIREKFMHYYWMENERYSKTIDRGHRRLVQLWDQNNSCSLSEEQLLELEKSFGFPTLLAREAFHNKGLLLPKRPAS